MASFFINSRFTPSATIKVDLFDDDGNSLATDITASHDTLGQFEVNAGTHNWLYAKVFYEFNSIKHFCETQYNTNFSQGVQGLTTAQATQLTNVENQLTTNFNTNVQGSLDAYTNKDDWKGSGATPPTATAIATAVRTELTTELGRIDENVSATKDSNIVSVNGTATTSIEDFQDFTSSDDTKMNNLISSFNRVKHSMIVTETTATTSASASAGLNQITLNISENAYYTSTLFVDSYCLLSPNSFTNDPLNNFQLLKITSQDTNPSESNKIRITFDENITNFTSGNSLKVMFLRGQFNPTDLSTIETALTTNRQPLLHQDLDAYTNKDDWKATGSGGGSGLTTTQDTTLNDIKDAVVTNRRPFLHQDLDAYANKSSFMATIPATIGANIVSINGEPTSGLASVRNSVSQSDFNTWMDAVPNVTKATYMANISSLTIPTASQNATAVRTELSTELARIDENVSNTKNANVLSINGETTSGISSIKTTITQSDFNTWMGAVPNATKSTYMANIGTLVIPTASENATAVRTELTTELSRIDENVSNTKDANVKQINGNAVSSVSDLHYNITQSMFNSWMQNVTSSIKNEYKGAGASSSSGLTSSELDMLTTIYNRVRKAGLF